MGEKRTTLIMHGLAAAVKAPQELSTDSKARILGSVKGLIDTVRKEVAAGRDESKVVGQACEGIAGLREKIAIYAPLQDLNGVKTAIDELRVFAVGFVHSKDPGSKNDYLVIDRFVGNAAHGALLKNTGDRMKENAECYYYVEEAIGLLAAKGVRFKGALDREYVVFNSDREIASMAFFCHTAQKDGNGRTFNAAVVLKLPLQELPKLRKTIAEDPKFILDIYRELFTSANEKISLRPSGVMQIVYDKEEKVISYSIK